MASVTLRSVKGSALTFTEMDDNFSNINTDKLENVSEDSTPQLGGNLDVNGNAIVSTSNGDIAITPDGSGKIVLDGLNWPTADGTTNYYLKTDGAGNLSWDDPDTDTNTTYSVSAVDSGDNAIIRLTGSDASTDDITLAAGSNITITPVGDTITIAATDTTGLNNVSEDTSPSLGGNLNVNGNSIVSESAGDIAITPDTTGNIVLDGLNWPQADGSADQVLTTNGLGQLSWSTPSGGLSEVVDDLTPELGGNLNCGDNAIISPVLEDYAETVYSLGSTDSPTITIANGNVQTVSITSGLSLPAFSDAATGQTVTLIVTGSGTASGTGAYKFAGGNTTLTSYSVISIFYDGTTYWASIATDFQ